MPKIYRDQRSVSVGVTDSPLAPINGHRYAILLSAPSTNRYTISLTGPAVLDQGITIYPGQPSLKLDSIEFG